MHDAKLVILSSSHSSVNVCANFQSVVLVCVCICTNGRGKRFTQDFSDPQRTQRGVALHDCSEMCLCFACHRRLQCLKRVTSRIGSNSFLVLLRSPSAARCST